MSTKLETKIYKELESSDKCDCCMEETYNVLEYYNEREQYGAEIWLCKECHDEMTGKELNEVLNSLS